MMVTRWVPYEFSLLILVHGIMQYFIPGIPAHDDRVRTPPLLVREPTPRPELPSALVFIAFIL